MHLGGLVDGAHRLDGGREEPRLRPPVDRLWHGRVRLQALRQLADHGGSVEDAEVHVERVDEGLVHRARVFERDRVVPARAHVHAEARGPHDRGVAPQGGAVEARRCDLLLAPARGRRAAQVRRGQPGHQVKVLVVLVPRRAEARHRAEGHVARQPLVHTRRAARVAGLPVPPLVDGRRVARGPRNARVRHRALLRHGDHRRALAALALARPEEPCVLRVAVDAKVVDGQAVRKEPHPRRQIERDRGAHVKSVCRLLGQSLHVRTRVDLLGHDVARLPRVLHLHNVVERLPRVPPLKCHRVDGLGQPVAVATRGADAPQARFVRNEVGDRRVRARHVADGHADARQHAHRVREHAAPFDRLRRVDVPFERRDEHLEQGVDRKGRGRHGWRGF